MTPKNGQKGGQVTLPRAAAVPSVLVSKCSSGEGVLLRYIINTRSNEPLLDYRILRASKTRAKRVFVPCFYNKSINLVKKRNGNNGNKNKAGFCTLFFLNESSLSSNPAKRGKIKNLYLNDKISFISSMYRLVKNKAGFCTLFEILRP